MFGQSSHRRRKGKSEGERPFWISYADLMTAMMVLFLSAMAVTIAAITRKVKGPEEQRSAEIRDICTNIKQQLTGVSNLAVDCVNNRISFGAAGHFATNEYRLPPEADTALAKMVPVVLDAADSPLGHKWMKQVVVEGYTDTVGGYLYNLHLSLQRSEWMMCLLMDPRKNAELRLSPVQLQRVRQLFLAGGVSFNNQQATADESRRVELRLDFYGLNKDKHRDAEPLSGTAPKDACQL
jgi:outer membrane protein OmpA-like peptidoglycan-associated protein